NRPHHVLRLHPALHLHRPPDHLLAVHRLEARRALRRGRVRNRLRRAAGQLALRPHRGLPLLAALIHALASAWRMNLHAVGYALTPACAGPPPPIRLLRPSRSLRLAPRAPDRSNTTGGSCHPAESPARWTGNPSRTSFPATKERV